MKFDFLLVGAGLFNAVIAREARRLGKHCLVIEKRPQIGGNLYCECIEGIQVHKYGAHIFHTNNRSIWEYMKELCEFNHYINSPLARYKDKLYNLPFNMNTFYQLWGLTSPAEVKARLEAEKLKIASPGNCEEQALALVGKDIYEKFIKEYTEKQWGQAASDLPAFIIKRIPLRFTYNNNYFNDLYQGIPCGGYNQIFEKCFEGCDLVLNEDFKVNPEIIKEAKQVVYTGMVDEYFDFCYGALEYRSLRFEHEILNVSNYQGNAVINYTSREVPFTRLIEHKHFEFGEQDKTVITREYPQVWEKGREPFYPVNTGPNERLYQRYRALADREKRVYFGGRLGEYRYYNMDQVVEAALKLFYTSLS